MLHLLLRARKRLSSSRGFTLIEALVTVTILGFLSAVSVTLIVVLINSQVQLTGVMEQQTTIERAYGFLSARLALAGEETSDGSQNLGIKTAGDKLDPLSLAGDQFFFTSQKSDQDVCFRLMYLAERKEIRVASVPAGTNCSSPDAADIAPKRGPGELVGGNPYALPDQARFDPALDSAYPEVADFCRDNFGTYQDECEKAFPGSTVSTLGAPRSRLLAARVQNRGLTDEDLERIGRIDSGLAGILSAASPEDRKIAPFQFVEKDGFVLEDLPGEESPSLQAGIGNTDFYDDTDYDNATGGIGGVTARVYLLPETVDNVAGRFYQQTFYTGQLCYSDGPSGSGGGLSGPITSSQIAKGAVTANKLAKFPQLRYKGTLDFSDDWSNVIPFMSFNNPDPSSSDRIYFAQVNTPGRYLISAGAFAGGGFGVTGESPKTTFAIVRFSSSDLGLPENTNLDPEDVDVLPDINLDDPDAMDDWTDSFVAFNVSAALFGQVTGATYLSKDDIIVVLFSPETVPEDPDDTVSTYLKMYWIGK